jgi:uncharacterized membrane protein
MWLGMYRYVYGAHLHSSRDAETIAYIVLRQTLSASLNIVVYIVLLLGFYGRLEHEQDICATPICVWMQFSSQRHIRISVNIYLLSP